MQILAKMGFDQPSNANTKTLVEGSENIEKAFFDKCLACAASKPWSKYTTVICNSTRRENCDSRAR